jgi:hypothetical protein
MATVQERFWLKVNKNGPLILKTRCWIWAEGRDRYGRFWNGTKTIGAHRWSYEFHKGPLQEGLCVCHECDEPFCVNPEHLFAGTHRDNRSDCLEKGRTARGSSNGTSKLTEKQVLEIRTRPIFHGSDAAIAREFNVGKSIISAIRNRKTWRHV